MPAEPEIVRGWLKQLGLLTVAAMDRREFTARVDALVPALAAEFPTRAFSNESVRVVARECPHGLPTFAEIVQVLSPWWKQNRPQLVAITNSSPAEKLERDDADRAAGWGAMTPEQLRRRIASLDDHPFRVSLGRILAGAVRRHAPHLVGFLPPEWLVDLPERKVPAEHDV